MGVSKLSTIFFKKVNYSFKVISVFQNLKKSCHSLLTFYYLNFDEVHL